jgi:hypothetical protein
MKVTITAELAEEDQDPDYGITAAAHARIAAAALSAGLDDVDIEVE